jgi:O-antigen/teichoic acid export membrane protein
MDQGLFAVSNFGLNVLLARWLTPADYGAFSVAYTLFLLLGTFHTAILTEPMLIYGAGKYKERLGGYLAVLLRGHWLFGAFTALLFGLASLALWRFTDSPLTPALFGLAVASPFILLQWLLRRACYVNVQPHLAAYSGALYMLLMGAGIFALYYSALLSTTTALLVMAAASLASGLVLVWQLGVKRSEPSETLAKSSLKDHWRYGRWAAGAAMLAWFPDNIFILALPTWWGLEGAAAYRVVFSILLPVMNITTALGGILLPALVQLRHTPKFLSTTLRIGLLFLAGPLVNWLLLGFFGTSLLRLLYNDVYDAYAQTFWLTGLIPVLSALVHILGAVLRALEYPRSVFWASVLAAILAVTLGMLMVYRWGVTGAFTGWFLTYSAAATALYWFLQQHIRRSEALGT